MRGLVSAALAALIAGNIAATAAGNSFAVRNVRVFDGDKTIPRATVVVEDGRIAAVGRDTEIPARMMIINGRGKTLLPGLIDSHVHVFPGAQADALRFGVTTELDMFDISRDFKTWKAQRTSLARTGKADTWAAGLGVTVKGGAPLEMLPPGMSVPTLNRAADAQKFVDARVAEGSDYIKLFIETLSEYHSKKTMPTLSRAEVCAVIAATHANHRLAIVHTQAEWAAREAIECGADAIAHMIPDRVVGGHFIALAKRHHIFFETTDDVWAGASGMDFAQKLARDPRVAPYLSLMQRTTLLATEKKITPGFFPTVLANTRALHAAGVPILAGTDSPNPATAHGAALHEELQILVKAGFTPQEALHAATALPDTIFHLGRRGRVAKGYRANLLLVDGDPTTNIADTLSIDRIWMNGYPVDRAPPKK
ncbi:MAG: amidohydrolase family protein [Alphaproteobacteria bacterium]|nr:amidohydrolase family protein [Alphaproteobacteria bacterium]